MVANSSSSVKIFLRLGTLALLFFLFLWGSYNRVKEAYVGYQEKGIRDERLLTLKERNESLDEELDKLGNISAVEREAKERFNLKRPGETVVVVLPEESLPIDTGAENSFFGRVREFFTHLFSE